MEQAKAWDRDEGDDWASEWERYDAASIRHHRRLFDIRGLSSTDRVLDIGCGTGLSTRDAARLAGRGHVLGVDLSARMLERGRELAEAKDFTNISFERADAQVHAFASESFDVAFSKFAAMLFGDPTAAFANIRTAVRPGGRSSPCRGRARSTTNG